MNNVDRGDTIIVGLMQLSGIFFGIIGSFLMYCFSDSDWVRDQAKNALNWQITTIICVGVSFPFVHLGIGTIMIFVVSIANVCYSISSAFSAFNGEKYTYKYAFTFLKS